MSWKGTLFKYLRKKEGGFFTVATTKKGRRERRNILTAPLARVWGGGWFFFGGGGTSSLENPGEEKGGLQYLSSLGTGGGILKSILSSGCTNEALSALLLLP